MGEEQLIFEECLPNMGALYSTFPVLVLDAVSDGDADHRYIDSGWCTCELRVAMLGGTLYEFSNEELRKAQRQSEIDLVERSMSDSTASSFELRTQEDVRTKHFLHEHDRQVAL